ncbi:hypothetical protein RFI_30766, partial [Reticulomyxa filosa]
EKKTNNNNNNNNINNICDNCYSNFLGCMLFFFFEIGFLYPWVFYATIQLDSRYWRNVQMNLQKGGDYKKVFGTGGKLNKKKPYLQPLIDTVLMSVKMVDFADLSEYYENDPFAHGATAAVSKAKLYGEDVAVKTWVCDELTVETVSDFLKECLLVSDVIHPNVVGFKGLYILCMCVYMCVYT